MGGARRGRPRGPGRSAGRPLQRGGRLRRAPDRGQGHRVQRHHRRPRGRGGPLQQDHPGRQGLRRGADRAVPGERPALLPQRQHADVRRHPVPGGCRRLRGAGPLLLVAAAAHLRRPGGRDGHRAHRGGLVRGRHAGRDRHRLRAQRAGLRPAVRAPAGGGRRGGGLLQHHRPDRQHVVQQRSAPGHHQLPGGRGGQGGGHRRGPGWCRGSSTPASPRTSRRRTL